MSIPRNIITCWFGPTSKQRPEIEGVCQKAREKVFSKDKYNHIHLTEENFDVNKFEFTRLAYEAGFYSYVADFARTWALYHYGGLYLDTDQLMLKDLDDEMFDDDFFMGSCIIDDDVRAYGDLTSWGLVGAKPHHPFIKALLDKFYLPQYLDFSINNIAVMLETQKLLRSMMGITKEMLIGLNAPVRFKYITIYPFDYFTGTFWTTERTQITDRTYGIQLYGSSWHTGKLKDVAYDRVIRLLETIND